jgi:osmotically-inducible protein OsmY
MTPEPELLASVLGRLERDARLDVAMLEISIHEGIVTLRGIVDSFDQKLAAGPAAERVAGVRAVIDELHVRGAEDRRRSDDEIACAALRALSLELPPAGAPVITLDGVVESEDQRQQARRAIRFIPGIRGVTNALVVRPARGD